MVRAYPQRKGERIEASRAVHDDRGRGKWFAPDTAAAPALALGRQGPQSS